MKAKKMTIAASLMLVVALILGSFSVAAADDVNPTFGTANNIVTTTVKAEETTAAHTDEVTTLPEYITTTTPITETTTEQNNYYDDSDYETDEEKEAYDDGYWDGYLDGYKDAEEEYRDKDYDDGYDEGYDSGYYDGEWDGYKQGYYEGYYDAIQDMEDKDVITIFDRWDAFIEDLRDRLDTFFYEIRDFFERLFKTGNYTPNTPLDPDADFIPDGTQATLKGDAEAQALCEEFNDLIHNFREVIPEPVAVTKNVDVGIAVGDVPAVMESTVNSLVEKFLVDDSTTIYYMAGDYAYEVQPTELFPEGLVEATKTVNADGTTDYRFVVIEEAAYYDGDYTTGVKYIDGELYYGMDLQHDYVADTLYIEVADLDPITIKSAEIVYPGATITAKTDANGRLIEYDVNMPVAGKGTAKVAGITLSASLEGYRNEGFVMNYDI